MAVGATVYSFAVELSDVDRGVYRTLDLKLARHPSESEEYLIARVLAYCLECTEGIAFSKGLAEPDEPALEVRDLTGVRRAWIEVGLPDAARLHRASKAASRVVVYTHKHPATLLRALSSERIHRAEALELYALDRKLIEALAGSLDRRMALAVSVHERHLYVTLGSAQLDGAVERLTLAPA